MTPTDAPERALTAFLSLSAGTDDISRALRALTLHMLEGHAPLAFAHWKLGPVLHAAVEALADVPLELPAGLEAEEGMARVDAWFVRHDRGLPTRHLAPSHLRAYLEHLEQDGNAIYGWLLGEIVALCGVDVRLSIPPRPFREVSRLVDLYWLTHLYLLDSRYLRVPVRAPDAAEWTRELCDATPWVLEQGNADLAGELAFCLQCVGESESAPHAALVAFLVERQQPEGLAQGDAHAWATALLALAGARERASTRAG